MVLAEKGLSSQMIQSYLSAVQSMQLLMGLPDPRNQSSLPLLRRVQAGIRRSSALRGPNPRRIRLPVTLAIHASLDPSADKDRELTWAVALLAFLLFCLGDLLLNRETAYAQATHLNWGEVAANDR